MMHVRYHDGVFGLGLRLPQRRRSSAVISVQLNSHVLRSIGTAALYYRAYNALDPAVLHKTVRASTVSSVTSTVAPLSVLVTEQRFKIRHAVVLQGRKVMVI